MIPADWEPENWETKKLGDFLDEEDLAYFEQVWTENGGDDMAFMDAMKPWFSDPTVAAKLETKGMIASYAKYTLPYFFAQAKQAQAAAESDDIVDRIMGNPPPSDDPSLN